MLKNKKSHYACLPCHKFQQSFSSISVSLTTFRLFFIENKGKGKFGNLLFQGESNSKTLKKCPVS